MPNYKLIIQYDGTGWAGWQIQNNAPSIQQKITDALQTITKEKITLTGSGRTDAGVHALGQTANFRCAKDIDPGKLQYSLNGILPESISIRQVSPAEENFHARFDAKKRSYIYLITHTKNPFLKKYSCFIHSRLNIQLLNDLSSAFLGQGDFTSFSKTKSDTKNKICNIYSARWKSIGDVTFFYIEADRFLHGMVRTVAGTMLRACAMENGEAYIRSVFDAMDRKAAAESVPACGLFLYKVKY